MLRVYYADLPNNPIIRRGRFITPIADLSALGAYPAVQIILLEVIILQIAIELTKTP